MGCCRIDVHTVGMTCTPLYKQINFTSTVSYAEWCIPHCHAHVCRTCQMPQRVISVILHAFLRGDQREWYCLEDIRRVCWGRDRIDGTERRCQRRAPTRRQKSCPLPLKQFVIPRLWQVYGIHVVGGLWFRPANRVFHIAEPSHSRAIWQDRLLAIWLWFGYSQMATSGCGSH